MSRGVLYYVWGDYNMADLNKSIASATKFGYKYEVVIDNSPYQKYQKRAELFNVAPFETTLHLDTDTVVMGNLDYGFEMAEKHAIACSIAPASSSYLAEPNTIRGIMHKDLPQYNCGVIFFSKAAQPVFERWSELLIANPQSKDNDQPYFAQSIYENLNPYVLPKTWNFRPHTRYESRVHHGEIKILHSRHGL